MSMSSIFAQTTFQVNGIYYQVNGDGISVLLTSGPGMHYYSGDVIVPASVKNTATGITYPVTRIGEYVFAAIRIDPGSFPTSVTFTLPSNIEQIRTGAFLNNTFLKTISLPPSIASIALDAFRGCSSLESIVIPAAVTRIGDTAFTGCSKLKTVTCLATIPPLFYVSPFDATIQNVYVPFNSIEAYKSTIIPGWGWAISPSKIQAITTAVETPEESDYLIKTNHRSVEIANAYGKQIKVSDLRGRIVFEKMNAQNSERFIFKNSGVYIITIDNFKKKILIK